MKKLLAILTSILLLCAMLPLSALSVTAATSGTTGDCTWRLDGTHLTISGNGAMGDYNTSNAAPWGMSITSVTIGQGVTVIGDYAFYNCRSLTAVIIPDSVTVIGQCAFYYCSTLPSVTIPHNITDIEKEAFAYCKALTSVTIPNGITTIKNGVFRTCSALTSVTIPDSVTVIEGSAFYECIKLTSLTIPDSVVAIGSGAFAYCEKLTSITIPDSVTTIGEHAFDSCTKVTSVILGRGVKTIAFAAFYGCSRLAAVTLPISVTTIGNSVFSNCWSLYQVNYAGSAADRAKMSIGSGNSYFLNATWNYTERSSGTTGDCTWTLDNGHLTISGEGAMGDYTTSDAAPWGKSVMSVTIENGVTTIGVLAFYQCSALTSVVIPESVMVIKTCAFTYCIALTSVVIPEGVTTIGPWAFELCTALNSVVIPDSVTTIENDAFYECESLTSVIIPPNVTAIRDNTFKNCSKLTSVTIPVSVITVGEKAFQNCNGLTSVYYAGDATKRAAISIGADNAALTLADWYYNWVALKDHYSSTVGHSVMETERGNGLAFRFTLSVNGMGVVDGNKADFTNAYLNYLGADCKVVGMGAIVTNDAAIALDGDLICDAVDDRTVIDVAAIYLQDLEPDSCAFAVRIKNIPETQLKHTIYARPYYIVEVDEQLVVFYSDINAACCADHL